MRKQCEEVSKVDEKILQRKTEGDVPHIEGLQRVPELVVAQLMAK